jgi:Fungal specific transcription factor domain
MAAILVDGIPSPSVSEQWRQRSYDPSPSAQESEASLPPRHTADHLVDVYFQYRTPHLPIVDRQQVEEALDSTYSWMSGPKTSDQAVGKHVFTTYMVLAIALCDLPNPINPSSKGRPSQSEGCFLSAAVWIDKIITYSKSDIETLRIILLLAQYIALNPSRGSLWHLAGTALRLSIDIGLHWETEELTLNMDPNLLHERRRLWYSTYQFDRLLCITLGRPVGISDESARVPLPSPWVRFRRLGSQLNEYDTHNQRAHNHLFGMSMLESEIKHVQHSQSWTPKLASPRTNYSAWILDIQPRLQEWYDTVPQIGKAHPSSIFAQQAYWDSMYHNAILLLYRPNSSVTQRSGEAMSVTFESSCKLIASIKILQREGKCESLWKTVHHLFMAGLGVIHGLWQSKEIRDLNPVRDSISTLHSCASTLTAMSETFPGAIGCRDIFDALCSATVDFLVTKDAEQERQNFVNFEKQVGDLLYGMQPSRGDMLTTEDKYAADSDLSAMLSGNGSVFGEMLNSAAQWPEHQNLDFSNMGTDSMIGRGMISDSYSSL